MRQPKKYRMSVYQEFLLQRLVAKICVLRKIEFQYLVPDAIEWIDLIRVDNLVFLVVNTRWQAVIKSLGSGLSVDRAYVFGSLRVLSR